MDIKPIIIAYSGSLDAYQPSNRTSSLFGLKKWFWTFKNNTVDASTRSAYFLIKAVKILREKYNISPSQLTFHFWGSINTLNQKQAIEEGVIEFFKFEGYKEKSQSLKELQEADVLFLPLEMSNTPGIGTLFIPGKLFEYLHSEKPILALCEPSDCRDILESSGLGIIVQPNKEEEIAEILLKIVNDTEFLKSIKANKTFIEKYNFKNKVQELATIFDSLNVE